jgi:hypothetical protein
MTDINTIQYGLMNKFSTGNPILDSVSYVFISVLVTTVITGMLSWMKDIFTCFANLINRYFCVLSSNVKLLINKVLRRDQNITKTVEISYITEEKKVNYLYKAVDWYLAMKHKIDYIRETPLRMSCEEELVSTMTDIKLNKRPTMNSFKSIHYKNHEIFFITNKDVITVFTDKERKRENYKITLSTTISINSVEDIFEDFCTFCVNEYVKSFHKAVWVQQIYTNNNKGEWQACPSNNKRKIETVVLQNNLLQEIKDDLDDFVKSEAWYHEWGIPYTRGYLLFGKPGCGKTSLIKGISNYTKRHMHYLMLNNVKTDMELIELLKKINYKETILVIEDIDCMTRVIEDRTQKGVVDGDIVELKMEVDKLKRDMGKGGSCIDELQTSLTLSGLLNAIDGIFNNDGRILIMTTNHPEVLDAALVRPGRIDRKIKFDYCTREQIKEMYMMMFNQECDDDLSYIKDGEYSPAEISSLFVRYKSQPYEAFKYLLQKSIRMDMAPREVYDTMFL